MNSEQVESTSVESQETESTEPTQSTESGCVSSLKGIACLLIALVLFLPLCSKITGGMSETQERAQKQVEAMEAIWLEDYGITITDEIRSMNLDYVDRKERAEELVDRWFATTGPILVAESDIAWLQNKNKVRSVRNEMARIIAKESE